MFQDGFFTEQEKLEVYNRAFDTMNEVKDADLRKRMGVAFSKLRAVNREFGILFHQAEQMELKKCEQAILKALEIFRRRGVTVVEKDALMSLAKTLKSRQETRKAVASV